MRTDIIVPAEARESRGKNEARRLRVKGQVPAILYGTGKDPVAVAVSPKEISKILHSSTGHNTIFDLDVQGVERTPVMIVDWQHDPVKSNLLHADLKRIDLTKRIVVKVPVHTQGDAKGVKLQGGLLEIITRDVEIECLPVDIPEHFVVVVTDLMVGQSIRAGDIKMAEGVKLVSPAEAVVAHVVTLRAEVAAATEETAAAAEPEVVKKGKKEEAPAADDKKKK